jgi:NAD(P)-dependent dehydrogenase (short-subunit alcohol dehydrogenase family)
MRLQGKVALLTGANDGIGKASAIRFVTEGARVVITGRRQEKGEQTLRELKAIGGNDCALFVQCDVVNEQDSRWAVEKTIEKFCSLDILVNCAAAQAAGTVLEARPEDYARMFNTNVMGYGLCAKAAIPYLLRAKGSAIVNIASLNGNVGTGNRTLYNASKAAVIEMTRSMAIDFPTIRINSVSPGFTRSDAMLAGLASTGIDPEECAALISQGVIMKRMAAPEEIAAVILFLASEDASYITGENIMADGGALCFGNYGAAFEADPRLRPAT